MAEKTVQGSDCIIRVKQGTTYLPFVCSKDISLEVSTGAVETTTIGDGQWLDFDYQNLTWVCNLSGVLVMDSTNWTGRDFFDNQTNFLKLDISIEYKDNNNDIYTAVGRVLIERTMFVTNVGQTANSDVSLKGCGALQIFAGVYECNAEVTLVTVNQESPDDNFVSIIVRTSLDTSYLTYSIDGGTELTVGAPIIGVSFNQFIIGYTGADGSHTITITPYCSNDLAGTPLTDYAFMIA